MRNEDIIRSLRPWALYSILMMYVGAALAFIWIFAAYTTRLRVDVLDYLFMFAIMLMSFGVGILIACSNCKHHLENEEHKVCMKCGYDRGNNFLAKCPECGGGWWIKKRDYDELHKKEGKKNELA